ncbi:hypothetical protein [Aminobacter sp. HY435]|uniref:hypothetical protein n=1 Tax=Aminobacter sp. HY435 TaxID=2970917 RepID=UPI0022B9CF9E|nr:hypothetical protein [Aminobacter sp. HY435]
MKEEGRLEYRCSLSPSDDLLARSSLQADNRRRAWGRFFWHAVFGLAVVLLGGALERRGLPSGFVWLVGTLIIIVGVSANMTDMLAPPAKAEQFQPVPVMVVIDEHGVTNAGPLAQSQVSWSAVQAVAVTDYGIGFWAGGGDWYIPLSAFASKDHMKQEYEKILQMKEKASQAVAYAGSSWGEPPSQSVH